MINLTLKLVDGESAFNIEKRAQEMVIDAFRAMVLEKIVPITVTYVKANEFNVRASAPSPSISDFLNGINNRPSPVINPVVRPYTLGATALEDKISNWVSRAK